MKRLEIFSTVVCIHVWLEQNDKVHRLLSCVDRLQEGFRTSVDGQRPNTFNRLSKSITLYYQRVFVVVATSCSLGRQFYRITYYVWRLSWKRDGVLESANVLAAAFVISSSGTPRFRTTTEPVRSLLRHNNRFTKETRETWNKRVMGKITNGILLIHSPLFTFDRLYSSFLKCWSLLSWSRN